MTDKNILPDRIAETFKNSNIFISGGTGFVGKALIEKLLRSTEPNKLYLLIRPKKGKPPHERIHDTFNNVVGIFSIIKIQTPKWLKAYNFFEEYSLNISLPNHFLKIIKLTYAYLYFYNWTCIREYSDLKLS